MGRKCLGNVRSVENRGHSQEQGFSLRGASEAPLLSGMEAFPACSAPGSGLPVSIWVIQSGESPSLPFLLASAFLLYLGLCPSTGCAGPGGPEYSHCLQGGGWPPASHITNVPVAQTEICGLLAHQEWCALSSRTAARKHTLTSACVHKWS